MPHTPAAQLTVELREGSMPRRRRAPERVEHHEKVTVELYRPEYDDPPGRGAVPDRTIELSELEVEFEATEPELPALHDSGTWSLDHVFDEPTAPADLDRPLSPDQRGFLWRLLFRLGWVRAEDDAAALGL